MSSECRSVTWGGGGVFSPDFTFKIFLDGDKGVGYYAAAVRVLLLEIKLDVNILENISCLSFLDNMKKISC